MPTREPYVLSVYFYIKELVAYKRTLCPQYILLYKGVGCLQENLMSSVYILILLYKEVGCLQANLMSSVYILILLYKEGWLPTREEENNKAVSCHLQSGIMIRFFYVLLWKHWDGTDTKIRVRVDNELLEKIILRSRGSNLNLQILCLKLYH